MGKKLTEQQVREIRRDKRPLAAISSEYGVSKAFIDRVRRGKSYAGVPDDANGTKEFVVGQEISIAIMDESLNLFGTVLCDVPGSTREEAARAVRDHLLTKFAPISPPEMVENAPENPQKAG